MNESNWRMIDRQTTMDIAHRCSRRVVFTGCSKAKIIKGMMEPSISPASQEKFIWMMNDMAVLIPRFKKEYQSKVYTLMENLSEQWEKKKYGSL